MNYLAAIILSSLCVTGCWADEEKVQHISIQIDIKCPTTDEFMQFAQSIPAPGQHTESFEDWKASFTASMNQLISLVESQKVHTCYWGSNVTELAKPAEEQ